MVYYCGWWCCWWCWWWCVLRCDFYRTILCRLISAALPCHAMRFRARCVLRCDCYRPVPYFCRLVYLCFPAMPGACYIHVCFIFIFYHTVFSSIDVPLLPCHAVRCHSVLRAPGSSTRGKRFSGDSGGCAGAFAAGSATAAWRSSRGTAECFGRWSSPRS